MRGFNEPPAERRWRRWRRAALVQTAVLILLLGWLGWDSLPRADDDEPGGAGVEPAEAPVRLELAPARFEDLPGWGDDDQAAAFGAFLRSCAGFERRRTAESDLAISGVGGRAADWLEVCRRAEGMASPQGTAARAFFERELEVFRVGDGRAGRGLFTGYYEPTIRGRRQRAPGYEHPLYRRPPELVEVDLGVFRTDLAGRRIAGRVAGGRLRPYAERRAIDDGALAGRGLEILWVDDPIDLFFLQIQGSGRVELPDGKSLRVGYAGQNGHPYFAIGRDLVERGAMAVEDVSMQSIRAWLETHPDEADEVMARNASFVFFREVEGPGPLGSLGVELTPERSLAVDRRFLPLGAPLWVETTLPAVGELATAGQPYRRLMMAQDTGGAIRGPLRADLFWGAGERAEAIAGRMRQEGGLWLLLPRSLAPTAARAAAAE